MRTHDLDQAQQRVEILDALRDMTIPLPTCRCFLPFVQRVYDFQPWILSFPIFPYPARSIHADEPTPLRIILSLAIFTVSIVVMVRSCPE